MFCFVGGKAYAEEPPELEDTYVIDGITYYNVNSSHISTPQLFYEDLLGTAHSSLGGLSIARYWLLVGAGLFNSDLAAICNYDPSPMQKYLLTGENTDTYTVEAKDPKWQGQDGYDGYVEVQCIGCSNERTHIITLRFSDFSIVPLILGNKENYISVENTPSGTKTDAGIVLMNDRAETASLSYPVNNLYTTGFETSFTGVNAYPFYSFREGLNIDKSFDVSILGANIKTTQNLNFEFLQAFEKSWTERKSESRTMRDTSSISVTAPPYTAAPLSISNTDTTTTTRYNCPIGISYKVTLTLQCEEVPSVYYTCTFFGYTGNAVSDLYNRAIKKITDPYIDWETFMQNSTTKSAVEMVTSHMPMSPTDVTTSFNKKVEKYELEELVPLYPLQRINFVNDSDSEKNLSIGGSFILDNIKLKGLNSRNGSYYNFKPYGNWIVVDSDGREITDVVVIEKDKVSGKMKCKAVKAGTVYLKFVIDEKSYLKEYQNRDVYITNGDLLSTAVIKVNVSNEGVTYKISGSYTGVALSESERIEGETSGKLHVRAYDTAGKEITYSHVWEQAEMYGNGMELEPNGYVKFTKPGTYHVRVTNGDRTSFSEWKEIYVEYYGDDEPAKTEIPDKLKVEATADTLIEILGTFVGGVSNDAEKLEGDGKLKVRAYDSTGKEIALKYTWEADEADGMTLTSDGTVSFEKPGLYHARVKSGEYYSEWAAIKVNQYAPARFINIPSNAEAYYNGNAQELLNNDARFEGGVRVMYGLSSDDITEAAEYNSLIPKGTEIGKYFVWCKIIGDESHDNSEAVCVAAEIIDASAKTENVVEGEKVEGKISKTFTLSNSTPVCWKIDKKSITISTSSLKSAANSDLIEIEVSPSDAETVPTNQITVTVSTIAGTTPANGEFEIPVMTSPAGSEGVWIEKEAILFDVAEVVKESRSAAEVVAENENGNAVNHIGSSSGGCRLDLGASALMFVLSALILRLKR